jgi:hypothetical protein
MKKMLVMISLLVGVLILVFAAEPCLSQALQEDFAGYRYRLGAQVAGTVNTFACRQHIDGQIAKWQIVAGHPLVDGYWYNWDTKLRRSIVEFTMPTGPNIACEPSEDPPEGFKGVVYGVGIVFGPFTLLPTEAEGGIWEGVWKVQFNQDGDRFWTAEAKGHGGLLEGKSLHVSTRELVPIPTYCPGTTPPAGVSGTACFDGWVLTPASVK